MRRLYSFTLAVLCLMMALTSCFGQGFNEIVKRVASDREADDNFGHGVSISGDYAIVGAFQEDQDANGANTLTDAGAAYIFKRGANGNWQQIKKIVASDRTANDLFGFHVSISGDVAIVGALRNDYDGNGANFLNAAGAAYIFRKDEGGVDNWGEISAHIASDAQANDRFGYRVALSNGSAIVGAHFEDHDENGANPLSNAGSAYFFETCQIPTVSFAASTVTEGATTTFTDASTNVEAGATYSWDFDNDGNEDATTVGSVSHTYPVAGAYTAKLTITNGLGCTSFRQINVIVKAPDEQVLRHILKQVASDRDVEDRFGFSVDTYGDYVVVGAFQEDGGLSDAGAAYVFKKDHSGSGAWGEVKKLTASDAQSDDYFGYSVSIDGEFIVVGAYSEDTEGSEAGAAYVFHKNEGGADNWGEVKKLTASDGQAGDWFGYSVDISGDNAIVSAYYDDDGGSDAGAAYIFNKDKGGSNNWGQVKKLVAADAQANDRGGLSVAISGEYAVLSAHTETQGGSNAGAAYIFKKDQGGVNNWGEIKKLLASDAQPGDLFGSDLSISGDNIIVGARFEDENGSNAGAAYIFSKEEGGADNWGETAKLIASDGEADDRFGYAVAISGKYALVGAPNEDGFGTDVGAAYLFEQNAAGDWVEVQKNTASDAYFGDEYGRGLALWGDRAVIGAQMEDQDANGNNIRSQAGSVYLYEGCQPPDIAFTAEPVILGNETIFTDQSTGVSGTATYAWDFNNDGSIESTTVGDVGYTYLNTGTYTAKLTINDDGCIISKTAQTQVFEASTEVTAQSGSEQGFQCTNCSVLTQEDYTVAAGANRLMVVGVYRNASSIISINFDGQNLTPSISVTQSGVSQFWYLPLGTGEEIISDLAITTVSTVACLQGGVTVFDYVKQDFPIGNTSSRVFNGVPGFTQYLGVETENILVDFLRISNSYNPSQGSNQTVYTEAVLSGSCENRIEGSYKPASSTSEFVNWSWGTSTSVGHLLMEVETCAPKAAFTATTVQAGNATSFTDASTRVEMGATYSWDFDDNGTEDDNTVGGTSYTYPNPGTYTAKLTITNANGCKDVETIMVKVLPFLTEGVFWTDAANNHIRTAGLNGENPQTIVTSGVSSPYGIDIDPVHQKIYWTDYVANNIQRSNFDGSEVELLVSSGLDYPIGIALDVVNEKMYWVDRETHKIQRANLDGSMVQDLVIGLDIPHGIALDVANNKMYWTDLGSDDIRRADLNGTNIEVLVDTGLDTPRGIALDLTNNKMYWVDPGSDVIKRADLDGTNVEDLVTTGLVGPYDIGLDVPNGKMYWVDDSGKKIQRANLDGSDVEELVTQASVDLGDLALILCDFELSLSASTVTQGTPTPFTVSSTGLSGTPAYSWDFNADGSEDDNTAGNTTYTYASPGNYTAELTITNGLGCKKTTSVDVTVDVNDNLSYDDLMKRVADDREEGDGFGYSVAVSGDYAVVGAYREEHDADGISNPISNAGAAYVFKKNAGGANNWGQIKKLVASDRGLNDFFGRTVAIDGDYIVVGAEDEDQGGNDAGAAYVFRKGQGGADNWGEVKKLMAADASGGDKFGGAISISGDYIVVGARLAGIGAFYSGTAYIFKKDHGGTDNWGQLKQLASSNESFAAAFGGSVSIDGNYLVVGAGGENSNTGAAYIFKKDEGGTDNWGEVKRIIGSDTETGDIFGNQVSISGDYVLVGAYEENTNGYRSGAAYLFKKDEGGAENWGELKKLLPADGEAEDYFAYRLAIYGSYALIGAYGHDDNGPDAGIAYLFRKDLGGADNWGEGQKISAVDASGGDHFGRSVGMHGSNMIVGAFFEDEDQNGNNTLSGAGSVYFYEGTDAAALPVTLAQFNAFREGDRARLRWQTSTEQNNYGFYIQRSRDGKDWRSLGFVAGQGDAYSPVDYHFTDEDPHTGVNYYRLKQEDYDGTPSYSEIRSIYFDGAGRGARVYPNPFSTFLTIENGRGALTVYDMLGRVLAQSTITEAVHQLDTGTLPEGPCIIRLQREDGRLYAVRLVKAGR